MAIAQNALEEVGQKAPKEGAFWMTGELWQELILALLQDRVSEITDLEETPSQKGRTFAPSRTADSATAEQFLIFKNGVFAIYEIPATLVEE